MAFTREDLVKEFAPRGDVTSGGEIYLPFDAAIDYVRAAQSHGFAVGRVEGFRGDSSNPYLTTDTGLIGDSSLPEEYPSWSEYVDASCEWILRLMQGPLRKDGATWFAFVLHDEQWGRARMTP